MKATVRFLRHEILGTVVVCVPFVLLVEVASASSARVPLRHHWQTTIAGLNDAYPVLHPLVAAMSTALFVPSFAVRQRALTEVLPGRGVRLIAVRAAIVSGWFVVAHLLVIAVLLIWAWAGHVPGRPSLWGVLPGIGGIVAWVGGGLLVARVVPRWWAPPVVAVVGYFAPLWAEHFVSPLFFRTGGASTTLYGLAYRTDVAVLQLVMGCTFAIAAVAAGVGSQHDVATSKKSVAVLITALVVTALTLATRDPNPYTEVAVDWRCTDSSPRLCVVREDAALLAKSHSELTRTLERLRRLDPALVVPATFREPVGQTPPGGRNVGVFGAYDDTTDEDALLDVLQSVSRCSSRWDDRDFENVDRVTAFLMPDSPDVVGVDVPSRADAMVALHDLVRC